MRKLRIEFIGSGNNITHRNTEYIHPGSVKYSSPRLTLFTMALAHPSTDSIGIHFKFAYQQITNINLHRELDYDPLLKYDIIRYIHRRPMVIYLIYEFISG